MRVWAAVAFPPPLQFCFSCTTSSSSPRSCQHCRAACRCATLFLHVTNSYFVASCKGKPLQEVLHCCQVARSISCQQQLLPGVSSCQQQLFSRLVSDVGVDNCLLQQCREVSPSHVPYGSVRRLHIIDDSAHAVPLIW